MRYAQLWLTHFNSYLVFIAFFYMNTSHLGNLGFYFFSYNQCCYELFCTNLLGTCINISLEYIPRSGVASPFVCNAKLPSKVFLPVWERGLGLQVLTNTCIRLLVALAQLSSDFSSGFSSSPSSKCIGQAPANMCWALIG